MSNGYGVTCSEKRTQSAAEISQVGLEEIKSQDKNQHHAQVFVFGKGDCNSCRNKHGERQNHYVVMLSVHKLNATNQKDRNKNPRQKKYRTSKQLSIPETQKCSDNEDRIEQKSQKFGVNENARRKVETELISRICCSYVVTYRTFNERKKQRRHHKQRGKSYDEKFFAEH